MAELMTVETILEADWQLQGFWTKPRFPLRTADGGWSDIDVLAYAPEKHHLVIAESKVQSTKKTVFAYTAHTQNKKGDILEYDDGHYFTFLRHVSRVCEDGVVFADFGKMVKQLTIQLVSNYFVSDDVMPAAIQTVMEKVRPAIPVKIAFDVRLETTLDVICRIIATENRSSQGRRYGHPVIDIARELNRYMHPDIRDAGRTKQATETIKKALETQLWAAICGEESQKTPES